MVRAICIGLLMAASLAGVACGADSGDYVCIERLSDRVLLAYWLGTGRCNLTAINSEKGLVVIDTEMSPRIMAPIKARIEKEFRRSDWACVINTHAHMHHAGGNCLFKGVPIVGHANLPADMEWLVRKQSDPEWKGRDIEGARRTLVNLRTVLPQISRHRLESRRIRGEIRFWELYTQDMEESYPVVPPSLTFTDRHTLDLGDLTLELVFFGRGHSLSDILIYIPQERLLITGAIAYQRAHLPEIGEESDLQDVHRFMAVLDEFLADDVKIDRVISSHSPPLRKSDLAPIRDYYQRMLLSVQAARKQGLTLEQTIERLTVRRHFPAFREPPPGDWAHGMHQRNLRNLWRILGQRPDAGPSGDAGTDR